MRKPLAVLAAACLLSAGCGATTPEDQAEGVVKTWFKSFNKRDPELCTEIYSAKFIVQKVHAAGQRGRSRCQRKLSRFGPPGALQIVLRSIDKTVKKGDSVYVSTLIESSGQPSRLTFKLTKSAGKYRIDALG